MNLLNPFLLRKQRKSYFRTIETLPLWNWWKLQETLNYKYLGIDGIDDYSQKSYKIYESIFNEFIAIGGLGSEYVKILELKRKWVLERSTYLVNEDKNAKMKSIFIELDIKNKTEELERIGGVAKEEALIILSENIGSRLDPKTITVKEFFDYLNYYKKKNG